MSKLNRENNINKGQLYGSDVMADPMFYETVNAIHKVTPIRLASLRILTNSLLKLLFRCLDK